MIRKLTAKIFSSVQSQPSWASNGPFHPPRNSTVVSAAITTMPAYSASRKNANRRPVYSVRYPNTSSESAIGMSNGGRRISASPARKNTTRAGSCHSSHHGRHALTMPGSERLPDQPVLRAQRDEQQRDQVGHQRDDRGHPEDRPVDRTRRHVLLLHELHAVGDELRPAVERARVHRPEPALHVRHHLVLGLAHDQRHGQEGGHHGDDPDGDLDHSGPHSPGAGTPGGRIRVRLAAPDSDSPGSLAPGQILATRAARTNSFRSGYPSNSGGSSSGRRPPGWPGKSMPNISCVSRSYQAAPG